MSRSFQDMLDCTSDAELGRLVRDRFTRMMDAAAQGIEGAAHPSVTWNADNKILRDHAARDSMRGNVASSKEIEDEEIETAGGPAKQPQSAIEVDRQRAANDAAIVREEMEIRNGGGGDIEGALHLARMKRINPAHARALDAAIKGFDRLK